MPCPHADMRKPVQDPSVTDRRRIRRGLATNAGVPRQTRRRNGLEKVPRQTLIRTDFGGGAHACVEWLAKQGRWPSHSVGMTITEEIHRSVPALPPSAWMPHRTRRRDPRRRLGRQAPRGLPDRPTEGHAADRPRGTAVPRHPVALHRRRRPAAHPLRHQHQGQPDRSAGTAAPTALHRGPHQQCACHRPTQPPLPLYGTARNQIWLEIVQLAFDLPAWMPMLAPTGRPAGPAPGIPPSATRPLLSRHPADHHRLPQAPAIPREISTPSKPTKRDNQASGLPVRPNKRRRARQQADGLPRKVEANLPSGQIVGVSSTISLCGSTMNLQPSLGSRNRTRVG